MLHLLLFNEGLLHYLSVVCVTMLVVCVNAFCILVYTSACGKATYDEFKFFSICFFYKIALAITAAKII